MTRTEYLEEEERQHILVQEFERQKNEEDLRHFKALQAIREKQRRAINARYEARLQADRLLQIKDPTFRPGEHLS